MPAESDDGTTIRLSPDQVAQLAGLLQRDGVRTVHLDTVKGRFAVTLGEAASAPASLVESGLGASETVCAASVGEFLVGHPSRAEPLVQPGGRVAPGDVMGLVRAGLVLVPVALPDADPRPATMTRVLVPAGTLVGYGTPLFEVQRH